MSSIDIQQFRKEYTQNSLDESEVHSNPFEQFGIWFEEAVKAEVKEPNAMTLSTVGADHKPHSRVMLLKGFDDRFFTFFTNHTSDKGNQIQENENVAIGFFWIELERQIRIEGVARKLPREKSEAYFKTRPRMSRIGAHASNQSEVVENRDFLENRFEELLEKFAEGEIPMPKYWGGYNIIPSFLEFWQGRRSRLHDRICYKREQEHWIIQRLSP